MAPHISLVGMDRKQAAEKYAMFLGVAAKIVETVAFETATHSDAKKTEQLLAIACAIEEEAAELSA